MADPLMPIPLRFWRTAAGKEPVREWLTALSLEDKRVIGRDLAKAQFGWPIGLPARRRALGSALVAAEQEGGARHFRIS